MNAVLETMINQFCRPAFLCRLEEGLASRGMKYRFIGTVITSGADTIRIKLAGRRGRGAIVAPAWTLEITYNADADLYDLCALRTAGDASLVKFWEGEGFDVETLFADAESIAARNA